MIARAAEIVEEPDGFATDQFRNSGHDRGLPPPRRELLEQLDARIDAFCAYVGTAGCFLGVTRELRSALPDVRRVVVEPAESPVLSEGRAGNPPDRGRRQSASGRRSSTRTTSTTWSPSRPRKPFAMARRAAREEGIFSGPSTGANLATALRLARELGPGRRVVTVQVDSGMKYLAGDVYRNAA